MYAVVDIETTGGYAAANGITEISIQLFDGESITGKYETLVNPHQTIPRYIQAMTGITDAMVADAPSFEDIAANVYNLLQDRVFVAHNVNFDYSFIKAHLAAHGYQLNSKKLCTVRLSRKLIPGYPSYSLGNLCHSLGIPVYDRHRAGGDAVATVALFKLLLEKDQQRFIAGSLQRNSKEQALPPHVPKEQFEQLPYMPGVYYFHNEKDRIVYVGKARNIKFRVNSHFSNNSDSRQKQNFMRHVHRISYQVCATELMAQILESAEIRHYWPVFNHSQKRWEDTYGIFCFEDQRGYLRLAIEKNKKHLRPAYTFHYLSTGHSLLRQLIRDFELCPKLCFLQKDTGECQGITDSHCHGACEFKEEAASYNERVQQAIQSLEAAPSYLIRDEGRDPSEMSCILVSHGRFYGMGYLPSDHPVDEPELLKTVLTPYKESMFIRNLVQGYAARYPEKVISFPVSVSAADRLINEKL
jgi:DNA polymerase-3 subunit epsilon